MLLRRFALACLCSALIATQASGQAAVTAPTTLADSGEASGLEVTLITMGSGAEFF